jgi:hypothetical protein
LGMRAATSCLLAIGLPVILVQVKAAAMRE